MTLSSMLAGQTLTQLPFFPYSDCRLAGYALPPKPHSLCELCWEGPLGAHAAWLFDVTDEAQGKKTYSYWASRQDMRSRARRGCTWCRMLQGCRSSLWDGVPEGKRVRIDIEVGLHLDEGGPPTGMHMVSVSSNSPHRSRFVYTLNDGETKPPYVHVAWAVYDAD